jgi:hypothetical protein
MCHSSHHVVTALIAALVLIPLTSNAARAEYQPTSDGAGAPRVDPQRQLAALAEQFPDGTHLKLTDHFMIVYDTSHAWADNRAAVLERAHDAFYRSMNRARLNPAPLRQRLVCVLFNHHDEFRDYALRIDRREVAWASGYYSGATNRIVLFNYQTSPKFNPVNRQMAELRARIGSLEGELAAARFNRDRPRAMMVRNQLHGTRRQLERIQRRYQAVGGLSNLANTFHEVAHLLAFNTGIQRRGVAYPLWLAEGIATSFETITPAVPFGPDQVNPHRLRSFEQAIVRDQLIPLEQFVTMTSADAKATQSVSVAYAQSWGLFHFLFTQHPEALRKYITDLAAQTVGKRDETFLRKQFIEAFGPTETLQPQFIRFIRELER